ncbi:hypothetical protein L3073_13990 [Ancylomarina sp. DW003]|nr:hypothetical protein [Ancylomarina sp. DW003]MDE5423326.1 hypothetical protein [Ancylomarina sp. DW003]
MKTYRYLYYKLYCIWLKKKNEPENAHINAVMTITFLTYLNLFNIPLVLMAVSRREVIHLPEINMNVNVLIAAFLIGAGILNYFFLARKKQHIKIIEEFKMESERKRKRGMAYTVLYLIITFGIPLYISFFTYPI